MPELSYQPAYAIYRNTSRHAYGGKKKLVSREKFSQESRAVFLLHHYFTYYRKRQVNSVRDVPKWDFN